MRLSIALFAVLGVVAGCGGTVDESIDVAAQAHHAGAPQQIITRDHFVTVSSGATIHVVEKYAASRHHRHGKRRAILMLPASLVTTALWDAQVPNAPEYNGLDRAARAGFYSYTLDYEGYGSSSRPADGKDVTADRLAEAAGDVVRWIRKRHQVPKVDLLGSSVGSALAIMLGSTQSPIPRRWIGHIVLTAEVYKSVTPLAAQAFLNPETEAFFMSVPGGYIHTDPTVYGPVLFAVDPPAMSYGFQVFPDNYAVGPTLTGYHLPVIDAQYGRAPMLQFWGDQDLITPFSDAEQLQAEYGGDHTLVVLNGGGHVPAWESVREQFWSNTFAFLDDDHDDHPGCDDD